MSFDVASAYDALIQFLYQTPIGLVETTLDGEIVMINPMSSQLLMPLSGDGSPANLFDVLDPVAPELRRMTRAFEAPQGVVCESHRIRIETGGRGRSALQVLSVSLLRLDASRLMAAINDVTLDVQREQRHIVTQRLSAARTDSLTRLPNRTVVVEQIEQALLRGKTEPGAQFAVILLDCDRFRQINDTHGREVGDEVLRLMASRLHGALRLDDALSHGAGDERTVARTGGNEFAVVLRTLSSGEDAHAVAQRLLHVLGQPYGIDALQVHASVSMGLVLGAQASGDANAVLRDVSIAMDEAQRRGGGYVVFEPAMRERALQRSVIESDLRRALADNELFVVYQPVIDLASGGTAGVEALVRWRHPTRGLVPPIEFIGVAEEAGLIGALGQAVLDTACREFSQWPALLGERAPRILAVNLSRAQLSQPGLVDSVRDTLRTWNLAPERLQLEVTESLAAQDENVQARLQELKALGLTLALDDFGTGYSSLASLHLLPVDTVKIDRSFVSQGDTSRHHRVLIEATLRVARSLGLGTVAEGIETEAQAAVLRELECDKGQGYLYAKPLTVDQLLTWLATRPLLPAGYLPAADVRCDTERVGRIDEPCLSPG